jgi:hypothetical protein
MASVLAQIILMEHDARVLSEWFEAQRGDMPDELAGALLSVVAQLRNLDGRRHNRPYVDPRR